MTRIVVVAAGLAIGVGAASAFPGLTVRPAPKAPPADLSGYTTTATAKTVADPAGDASPAATGYLGLTVERDPAGRPVVDTVQVGSPAQAAGIRKGDVVTHVGERTIGTPLSFREWIQAYAPGESVKLGLLRDGKPTAVTAQLTATSRPKRLGAGPPPFLGLQLQEVKEGDGVKVQSVAKGSPAEAAKLKPGDWILRVNREEINRPARLLDVLQQKKPGDEIIFTVVQDKKEVELKATLAAPERPQGKGGFGGRGGGAPPSLFKEKTLKVAVIGIEFSDTKHNAKVTPEELEAALFLARGTPTGKNSTGDSVSGSLNDYLYEVSATHFQLDGKAPPWITVDKKRGDYVQGSGTSNRTAVLADALTKLTAGDKKDARKRVQGHHLCLRGVPFGPEPGVGLLPARRDAPAPGAGVPVHARARGRVEPHLAQRRCERSGLDARPARPSRPAGERRVRGARPLVRHV